MDGWYGLTEHERYMWAIKVACPRCLAHYYRDCVSVDGQRVGMVQRYAHSGIVAMHHEREQRAKASYEAEQHQIKAAAMALEWRMADEASRTCPWCGFLAGSREELTEHEAECE
jgi:hypothetical protein